MPVNINSTPASPRPLDRATAVAAPRAPAAGPAVKPASAPPAPRHAEFQPAGEVATPGAPTTALTCSPEMAAHLLSLVRPGGAKKAAEVAAAALGAKGFERALLEVATSGAGTAPSNAGLPAGLVEHARTTWELARDISAGRVSAAVERFAALPSESKELIRQPLRTLTLDALRHTRYSFDEQVALHAALCLPEAANARLESFKREVDWMASSSGGTAAFSDVEVDKMLESLGKLPESERAAATGEIRAAAFDEAGVPKKSFEHGAAMERLRTAVGFEPPPLVAPTAGERERARAEAGKALDVMIASREPSRREVVAEVTLTAPLLLAASREHPVLGRLAGLASLPFAVPVGAAAKGLSLLGRAGSGSLVAMRELKPWLERAAVSDGLELAAHASVARILLHESPLSMTIDVRDALRALVDMGASLHGELQDQGHSLVSELLATWEPPRARAKV